MEDFDLNPVILSNGILKRCKIDEFDSCVVQMMNYSTHIPSIDSSLIYPTVFTIPQFIPIKVETFYDVDNCNMQWLPEEVRYCIGKTFLLYILLFLSVYNNLPHTFIYIYILLFIFYNFIITCLIYPIILYCYQFITSFLILHLFIFYYYVLYYELN